MITVAGVHHIAIIASDLDASLAFYCDLLGFAESARNYRPTRDSWKVDLVHASGAAIELFTFPEAPARPSTPEAIGLRHLAFAVTDIKGTYETLAKAGLDPEAIRTDPYTKKRFLFVADPDRLPIEFYEVALSA